MESHDNLSSISSEFAYYFNYIIYSVMYFKLMLIKFFKYNNI